VAIQNNHKIVNNTIFEVIDDSLQKINKKNTDSKVIQLISRQLINDAIRGESLEKDQEELMEVKASKKREKAEGCFGYTQKLLLCRLYCLKRNYKSLKVD